MAEGTGVGSRRPTIEDVAAEAGVSVATVSRALRGLPNVAEATQARVFSVAEMLDYRPDPNASRLASGRMMTVGLVAPYIDRWYASRFLAGFERVFAGEGYDILVVAAAERVDRLRFMQRLSSIDRRVDALALVDFFVADDELELARQIRVPVVTFGERRAAFHSILTDNVGGTRLATEHLLALGHRRIALLAGSERELRTPGDIVPRERREGFHSALQRAGLRLDPTLDVDGGFNSFEAATVTGELLDLNDPPTAVVAMSDEMAFGALEACQRRGIRVPEDLSIVGFDDHDLAWTVGLTTVRQPFDHIGERAADLLLHELQDPSASPRHDSVEVELVERRSTAAPRTSSVSN